MDIDKILQTFNSHQVRYILIGGMNFLLRHEPLLTYDIDLWIADEPANLVSCHQALSELSAEWGTTDDDWGPVAETGEGWLMRQSVFCLTSPSGAIDIFRRVQGLDDWQSAYDASVSEQTASGIAYRGLSDADMLRCQEALDESVRKQHRMEVLRRAIEADEAEP